MTIRTNTGMMPGGIQYQDPRTPAARWTDDHTFLDERAQQVISFRLANPSIYPEAQWTDTAFVKQQIVDYNCARIGYDGNYCLDYNPPPTTPAAPPAPRLCPDCGIEILPKYCPTCAGRRITGYECPQCHKEFPK